MKKQLAPTYLIVLIFLYILFNINIVESKQIPLIFPDSTNTKLELNEEGLSFLNSIKNKIAIVSIAGIAKTGKSFMINNLLGLKHTDGFKVGIDFKPGTKGITVWDVPFNTTIDGEEITVVFMDTEGLAAPGNPTDSYDPKLCALSVLFSSLFVYNLKGEIQIRDINMLHSVATLSKIFEKKFNQSFPFPPILFVVQNFEHELRDNTPEMYLKWVLEEKENLSETDEIKKYNETVRVVKQFPSLSQQSPNILLMSHPHRMTFQSKLPHLPFDQLDFDYKQKIQDLKLILKNELKPKLFNFMKVNGEFLADLSRELVHSMNTLDGYDVGPALVRELSSQLMKTSYEIFLKNLTSIELPQNELILKNLYFDSRNESLNLFLQNCTGGIESFDNAKSYAKLISSIEDFYEIHKSNNTYQSELFCTSLLTERFKEIRSSHFSSVEEYDYAIIELKSKYVALAKGPDNIKKKVFENFMWKESSLKRELVMRENSQKDFKQLMLLLVVTFAAAFITSLFAPLKILKSIYNVIIILIILIIVVFHNILETESILSFEDIQYAFNFFKGIASAVSGIKNFVIPIIWKSYSIVKPLIDPYKKQLFLISIFIMLIAFIRNYFKEQSTGGGNGGKTGGDPILPLMSSQDEDIFKLAVDIIQKKKKDHHYQKMKKETNKKLKSHQKLTQEEEEFLKLEKQQAKLLKSLDEEERIKSIKSETPKVNMNQTHIVEANEALKNFQSLFKDDKKLNTEEITYFEDTFDESDIMAPSGTPKGHNSFLGKKLPKTPDAPKKEKKKKVNK
eukprot:gene12479-6227_t